MDRGPFVKQMTRMPHRARNLNVRLDDDTLRKVHEIARERDESVSHWIRRTIREAHERAFGAPVRRPRGEHSR